MAKLKTFVLVYEDKTISPELVTVREYADWMERTFDEIICHQHLYLNSKKIDGQVVSEWHPGTRIGNFFDHGQFFKSTLHNWYLPNDGKAMKQLVKHGLAELKDCSTYFNSQRLRLYTVEQIQLYIKNNVDRNFQITTLEPKQIVLSKNDNTNLIQPAKKQIKKALF